MTTTMSSAAIHKQEDVCPGLSDNPTRKKTKYTDVKRTPDGGFEIKTYYPTLEQMKDFSAYMKHIHEDGGHRAGLAKIVPPSGYNPRKIGYDDESLYKMEITCPIRQEVSGEGGLYQQMNIVDKKKMTVREFKRLSEGKHPTPMHSNPADLDRMFWKNVFTNPSIYGADVPGTLFDSDFEEFNLTKLNTILDDIQGDYGVTIQGVNTTYLYFGMWKSSFCWHTEDMDLYSINYLHTGAAKSWYCIAPEYGRRFERLAESFFPHSFKSCKAFLRHKTTLISPQVLKKYSIPFSRATQSAGEFMVTFPYSYHSGYNNGFNIAEATNFATEHWIDFGKWATRCECSAESVKISMQTFVSRYQPDRYENWIRGKDVCKDPRDPKHVAAAPRPTEHDLYVMGVHERFEDDHYAAKEQEDDKRRVALQQNLSSNLKNKSKSLKKTFKSIEETYQRYSELLLARDGHHKSKSGQTIDLPHFSPIPTEMAPINEYIPIRSCDNLKLNSKGKPDYEAINGNTKKDKMKAKKDEKINQKKEQRARERIIASQKLLQFLPITFTHEKRFNRCIAALPPHCAVCQILMPHPIDDENIWGANTVKPETPAETPSDEQPSEQNSQHIAVSPEGQASMVVDIKPTLAGKQVEEFKLPEKSQVLLPRVAISDHAWPEPEESPCPTDTATKDDNTPKSEPPSQDQPDPCKETDSGCEDRIKFLDINIEEPYELLQCSVCMLSVHGLCYGVTKIPERKEDWVCDRCIEPNRSVINCSLCPCRGGALKPYGDSWVHIACALTSLKDVKLRDLTQESRKSNGSKLPDSQYRFLPRLNCNYCKNVGVQKYVQGNCIRCAGDGINKCETVFHPTCGHRNGAQFEIMDYHMDPKVTNSMIASCAECIQKFQSALATDPEEVDARLEPLKIDSQVIAYSKKRECYWDGIIIKNLRRVSYELFFPNENEVDANVDEKELLNTDTSKEFKLGEEISVKTRKNGKLIGKFRRKRCIDFEYMIKFVGKRPNIEKVNRGEIYVNIDQMPEELIGTYLENKEKGVEDCEMAI